MVGLLEKYLRYAYPDISREKILASLEKQSDEIGQKNAERFTRGNVAIQNGNFRVEKMSSGAMHPRLKRLLRVAR